MEDFQSKYSGEQVEEMLDQIANGEVGGGASVYTWEWDGNEQGSVADEVFTSIYNSDVLYLRYAGMDIPAIIARAEQTIIILASIQAGDSLLNIKVSFTGWNYTAEIISTEIGDGGGSVYKWRWNNEMTGTFTEEEFESIKNADVIYISVNVAGMEATYYVDTKWEIENTLQIGSSVLVLEDDTGSSFVASLQNIAFTFDNTSKIWNALVGGAELISNEQLASALENKQDTIEDLEEIRQGAAKGNTALQKDAIFKWDIPINDEGDAIVSGELTEEEYNGFMNSDVVIVNGVIAMKEDSMFVVSIISDDVVVLFVIGVGIDDNGKYKYGIIERITEIPTKTSQLENDSNFVSSDNLRTINGQSIVGSGDIEIDAITVETDPVFSASPAASITEEKKAEWDNKVDKVTGKGLSTEDFTTLLKTKLEGLSNYDDTTLSNALSTLRGDFDKLVSGDTTTAIKTFNEVIAFLDGVQDSQDLSSIIASIEQQIAGKMDKVTLATVATSGSYNDLSNKPTIPSEQVNADWNATSGKAQILNKPTIPSAVTESTVSGWGFTKNTGTYSKPSTGIPKTDLANAVQTSLGKADTALQSYTEQYKGTVTGVKINGTTKNPSSGVVDLGTVITSHQDISGKQDKLVSGTNIKTINGTSILGSGNIEIGGGSSSSGGAYPEVDGSRYEEVNGIYACYNASPNTFYVFPECASLTFFPSEDVPQDGLAHEYLFQFTSGATAASLILPEDIKWANDAPPTIAENMIYQVSILKGLASVLEFSNAAQIVEISFTVMGQMFIAIEGMTWEEFINSEYNSGYFVTSGTNVRRFGQLIGINEQPVLISDSIINGMVYGPIDEGPGGAD